MPGIYNRVQTILPGLCTFFLFRLNIKSTNTKMNKSGGGDYCINSQEAMEVALPKGHKPVPLSSSDWGYPGYLTEEECSIFVSLINYLQIT